MSPKPDNLSLREYGEGFLSFLGWIDDQVEAVNTGTGEVLPIEQLVERWNAVDGGFVEKAGKTLAWIKDQESEAAKLKDQAADRRACAAAIEARVKVNKAILLAVLQARAAAGGESKVRTPQGTPFVSKTAEFVKVVDEAAVPREYYYQPDPLPLEVDKAAIEADIRKGVEVPGAKLESTPYLGISIPKAKAGAS